MKRWFGMILVVLLTASAGWAQQSVSSDVPATKEDIEKLFVAMHLRERMEDIIQNTRKQTKLVLTDLVNKQADVLTPKEISQLQSMMDDMIDDVYKDYPLEAILQDMVPVYQKHLTESDVNQLIAIYGSPIGQKLLREVPAMTSEAMQISYARLQPKMGEIMDKLRKRMEQMVEEDQKQKDTKTK
jgi:uncharacterized protein